MSDNRPQVEIYTDGGADPNPGPGGWGAILLFTGNDGRLHEKELSGGADETTNNRMELTAAIEALNALKQACEVTLYTDSQYLKNGITKWLPGWKAKHWKNVQNVDLWQLLDSATQRHHIEWQWVKGHAGNTYNERADELATAAMPKAAIVADTARAQVYLQVSGPANNKTGAGGWAAAFLPPDSDDAQYYRGWHDHISPNHLALFAAVQLLQQLDEVEMPLQIYCDNGYLVDGITQWVAGWRAKGWAKDIKFKDDWQQLDQLTEGRDIHWVKGKGSDAEGYKTLKQIARDQRDLAANHD